jgi:hypothetical protein
MPRISKKDWENLPIEQWSSTTHQCYLFHLTKLHFGIDYQCRNFATEKRMINNLVKSVGNAIVKEFIEECVRTYKPTAEYPYIQFWFMLSYRKDKVLPRLQKRHQEAEKAAKEREGTVIEDLGDWY